MDETQRIEGHLDTLSICHYVYAALAACFSCFGGFYVVIGQLAAKAIQAEREAHPDKAPPPEMESFFSWMFTGIGIAFIVLALTVAVLCFLSARAMKRRRNRTLSLVVAGLVCMTGLFGIALGVFTFVVLLKPETKSLYEATPAP